MTQRRKGVTIKFIPALCMGILLFTGCGEPNLDDPKVREKVLAEAMDASNLQTRQTPSGEELRYAPNQEQPYTGWVKSGRSLAQFQRGELHGIYITWYRNQQNSEKGVFKGGRIDGLWTKWYENGQKSEEGPYKNDNRNGAWVFWHENGQKSSKGTYKNGIKNGLWIEWYADGVEQSKGKYKNGIKDGLWIEWYTDGTEKLKIKPTDTEVVLIPAGEFRMGSRDGDSSEQPVHTVYVDALYMDIYEGTNAQYKKFVDANPQWRKDRIPRSYHNGNYLNTGMETAIQVVKGITLLCM